VKKQTKAYLYGLTTVILWSTIATASKLTLRHYSPAQMLFVATVVSTVLFAILLSFENRLGELRRISRRQWLLSIGFGLLNPFCYYLILFQAYNLLPAQQAQIINYTWAITLSLLSIPFLKQKVTALQWLAIAVSYGGVLVIATKGELFSLHFDNPLGVALALLSTLLWAMYWILNTRDDRDPVLGLFLNFICSVPFITLYVFLVEGGIKLNLQGMLGGTYIGIFEMGISFVLWLKAMKCATSTAKVANLIFIAPFTSLFLIHYLVGETIYPSTVVGLFLVVGGLILQGIAKEK
jgi:drug/metabolite transporter (DMT)-like permease